MTNEIVLYQPDDQLSLEVKVENDTVWLNRNQMAVLFDRDVKTIGKHINNALQEELAPTVAKNATLQNGTQAVAKNATPYENQVVAKFATPYEHASHDRWLIVDDTVYHCGHSLKDMGQKLSAIAQLGVDADDILKKIR